MNHFSMSFPKVGRTRKSSIDGKPSIFLDFGGPRLLLQVKSYLTKTWPRYANHRAGKYGIYMDHIHLGKLYIWVNYTSG